MPLRIRRATIVDADAVATVFSASFGTLTLLPVLHTVAEDHWFIENMIFKDYEVLVTEDDTGIVSFLALQGEEARLLYTRPDRIGEGAGTRLIEAAKKSGGRARIVVLSG
jgi:GNAT superfamily N-acetyltransferase